MRLAKITMYVDVQTRSDIDDNDILACLGVIDTMHVDTMVLNVIDDKMGVSFGDAVECDIEIEQYGPNTAEFKQLQLKRIQAKYEHLKAELRASGMTDEALNQILQR